MHHRIVLWRARLELATFALTRFRPMTGAQDPPDDQPPADPPPADDSPKDPPPRSFTQADLDRVVQDRVARAQATERAKYEGFADLKAKAAKFDEIEQANASELDKATRRGDALERERNEARERQDAANARVAGVLRRSAIVAEAARQGAIDTEAVTALIPVDQVTVGDDDTVTGADKAVKALLEAKPYLVGKPPPPGPSDGGPRKQSAAADTDVTPGFARMMSAIPKD